MLIKTKLTQQDFVNVNFVLLYRKFFIKLLTAIGLLYLLFQLLNLFTDYIKASPSDFIYPFAMLAVFPLMTYFGAKRNYAGSARISETIEYYFNDEFLEIKGESFTSQLSWDKFYKVTETKNWLLIWQNNSMANVIPKRDVWESQQEELKILLSKHRVKNNLK